MVFLPAPSGTPSQTLKPVHSLGVSNVERSLTFYEAALKPLNIKFFLPYKGEGDHPDLWGFGDGKRAFFWIKQGKPDPASIHWGFMAENNGKVDECYRAQYPLVLGTIFHRGHEKNTIRDTTPPIYLTRTGIRSKSSIKASNRTSHRQGTYSTTTVAACTSKCCKCLGDLIHRASSDSGARFRS
jgi:hypothetical protein